MARQIINPRSAPIVWSTVKEAFDKINSNFTELYSTIGGDITPVDFTGLPSSIIPSETSTYSLGSVSKRWKEIYVSDNGISIGNALIVPENTTIKLPAGSKVGNKLINDPADVGFGTIAVAGQDSVVADNLPGILTLSTGAGISILTDAADDEITIANTGVIDINTGVGISVAGGSTRTITNTGVTSATAGLGISLDASTGPITVTNEGIVGLEAGTGISIGARSEETGRVIITNTAPATGLLIFKDIQVQGQPLLTAQSAADRLEFVEGTGIGLTTSLAGAGLLSRVTVTNQGVTQLTSNGPGIVLDSSTGNITVSFDNRIDIIGSVFADDSSRLVDAENKQFFGDLKGSVFADDSSAMVNAIDNSLSSNTLTAITGSITDLSSPIFRAKDIYAIDSSGVNISANGFNNLVILETSVELQNVPVNIQNNLNVSGSITGDVTGDVTGSVFSDGSTMIIDGTGGKIVGPVENDSVITTALTTGKVEETVDTKTGATGTVDHDCAATHVFFHTSIAANFTANFTNLGLETGRATTVTLILNQGSPAYIPNAVQIGGAAQTIQWQASTPPSGNVNKTDIVSFSIVNDGGVYYVYGQLTTFGT